jgi:hypothetical protein
MKHSLFFVLLAFFLVTCSKKENSEQEILDSNAYRVTKVIEYNNKQVQVVIDKPSIGEVDVLLVFHGTVSGDDKLLDAANNALDVFKNLLEIKPIMIVSVAYPQEGLLIGDNIVDAEAALLWVQQKAAKELNIRIKKVFMAGHSQGGYVVTRLNTMHKTDGVIANAPGPLNLVFRCRLEENGNIPKGKACTILQEEYGSTMQDSISYFNRSLLNFTSGFKSDILFFQGLNDSPIQLYSWPNFKTSIQECTTCAGRYFIDLPNLGHAALFESEMAKMEFNSFLNERL